MYSTEFHFVSKTFIRFRQHLFSNLFLSPFPFSLKKFTLQFINTLIQYFHSIQMCVFNGFFALHRPISLYALFTPLRCSISFSSIPLPRGWSASNSATEAEAGGMYRGGGPQRKQRCPRVLYLDGSDIRRGNDWSAAATEL